MTVTNEVYLRFCSLSVYKGILGRSVVKAFFKLLSSLESPQAEFLEAYGELYSLLCQRGYSNRFAYCMQEAALFDDNCFTRAATANSTDALPQNVLYGAEFDLETVCMAARLTPDDIVSAYKYKDSIKDIASLLPKWETGEPAKNFEGFNVDLKSVADFHKNNGCGMFARYHTFIWRAGGIEPVMHPDKVKISDLKGYEYQRNLVFNNTLSFIENKSCNNCLLYGDKGTGKSTTVKAVFNELKSKGLRIVEIPKERLMDFPLLVEAIAGIPMKFIIFIDDLSFQKQDESYASLKAVLEGGLTAKPDNALIYATSNRRHLVKESFADNGASADLHPKDSKEEGLSLSDRFGLSVCYSAPGKDKYLEIVLSLAQKNGITMDEAQLFDGAEKFALERGGRSPRCAKQYIKSLFN